MAAFLFLAVIPSHVKAQGVPSGVFTKAEVLNLHAHPTWLALLHVESGHVNITDKSFLLSRDNFSPKTELSATLNALYSEDAQTVCHFPARYLWLRSQLELPTLPVEACPEVKEFLENAPTEVVSLVFASESLTQPASMLGHAFLKLQGHTMKGELREHAISFFTDADTYNLPKLFVESLITGKNGYFALSPYQTETRRYVEHELRSMWEFDLDLSPEQIRLLQLHLLELKQTSLTYFFHRYNCATVLRFIAAISGKLPESKELWVTPKDVIKDAAKNHLIADQRVITPSQWMLRALADQISLPTRQAIAESVGQAQPIGLPNKPIKEALIEYEYAIAYNNFANSNGRISNEIYQQNLRNLSAQQHRFDGLSIYESGHLNPVLTPNDSQISLGGQLSGLNRGTRITFRPVSHELIDDNRNYPTETSLELMSATIKTQPDTSHPILERLALYSIKSLIPYDPIAGGISGKLSVAFEPIPDHSFREKRGLLISGALGRTVRPHPDIDIYGLFGGGFQHSQNRSSPLINAEVGLVLRGIWGTKTVISHQSYYPTQQSDQRYQEWRIQESIFFGREHSANLGWRQRYNEHGQDLMFEFAAKIIF